MSLPSVARLRRSFTLAVALCAALAPAVTSAQPKPDKVTIRYGYLPVPTVPLPSTSPGCSWTP